MTKTEIKKAIKEQLGKPKKISIMFWLDFEAPQNGEEYSLDILIEVQHYDESQYYELEVLETGEKAIEFDSYDKLLKRHLSAFNGWERWIKTIYPYVELEAVNEVVHI